MQTPILDFELSSRLGQVHERFAVIFRNDGVEAAGSLEIEQDRLLLHGRSASEDLDLEIPSSEVLEVHVGTRPSERLNGYRTLVLERRNMSPVQLTPLGVTLLPEIADLLVSLTSGGGGDVLAISVPLKPECLDRARDLLRHGPPIDPASLGLEEHEVYLDEDSAVFVFRGKDVRARVGRAVRQLAIWQAGVVWQRCFAGPPAIVEMSQLSLSGARAYRWAAADEPEQA